MLPDQPDTAAIRAQYDFDGPGPSTRHIRDLCDALDAARADLRDSGYVPGIHAPVVHAGWKARAEAAEARIANAYDISQQWPDSYHRRMMFRALTKGTGQ